MNRAEKRRKLKLANKTSKLSPNQLTNTIDQSLNMAMQYHSAGMLSEAKKLYKKVLKMDPKQYDALHLLGAVALQSGKFLRAYDLIDKAIAVNPNVALFYTNRGLALQNLMRQEEAIASYDMAIKLKPDDAKAFLNIVVWIGMRPVWSFINPIVL